MSRSLFVHFLPDLLEPSDLSGHTAVVIDVLRASSTIATAVAAGVRQIIPCQTVDQAFQIRQEQQAGDASLVLLGGERGGMKIDGFDLSNSPQDYTAARVANRTIAFTTTNGTRAMSHCVAARRILVGAFVNLHAVCEELVAGNDDVHLVCAGTDGKPTAEDILFAGAVCDCLLAPEDADHDWNLSDSARIACLSWRQAAGIPEAGI
ncbi:MAG: 2-phosphosulfolactate phosphatase, partial [Planctomycetaceae bacterium]|nr:2-phosphosulfolactate phosphatase [Planctomycetaceae bacterium]